MELSIDETAQSLNLPSSKVKRWISQGHIPIRQNGDICVFNESVLEKWAQTHHLSFCPPGKKSDRRDPPASSLETRSLLPAMMRGGVYHDVDGKDRCSVLNAAVRLLKNIPEGSRATLYDRLLERESLMSTGIGKGIAFPHPRTPLAEMGDEKLLATFFLKNSVDFDAIDGKPVNILFMLICPTTKDHLNLLSRLAFCVRDDPFVFLLKTSPEAEKIFFKIAELERLLDKK